MARIGMVGPIGVTDIGDIALLHESLSRLEGHEVVIFSLDVRKTREQVRGPYEIVVDSAVAKRWKSRNFEYDRKTAIRHMARVERHGVGAGPYSRRFVDAFSGLDGLYYMGGGYFNKYWRWFLYYQYLIPMVAAKARGIPVFVSGITFGPFEKGQLGSVASAFEAVKSIILRDESTDIKNHRFDRIRERVVRLEDDLMYSESEDFVVVQLHKDIVSKVAPLLKNANVVFVPFSTHPRADLKYGRELKKLIPRCKICMIGTDYEKARELIRRARLVISTRLHPQVFANAAGTPGIGIVTNDYYEIKLAGVGCMTVLPEDLSSLADAVKSPREKWQEPFDRFVEEAENRR